MSKKYYAIPFVLAFFSIASNILLAQTRNDDFLELKKLRTSPNFNPLTEAYIDLLARIGAKAFLYKPDSTLIYLNEAYALSKKIKYVKGQSKILNSLGNYYIHKGHLDQAYEKLQKSLAIADKNNLQNERIDALNYYGGALWQEGKNELALSKYLAALPIAEKVNDVLMMGVLNGNIALLYDDKKDYDTALLFNEKSLKISKANNLDIAVAQALLNRAVIYKKQKKYALAEKTVNECIAIFQENKNIDWLTYSYMEIGSIAIEQHHYLEAQKWFEKSIKIIDEIDLIIGYTKAYLGMAKSYFGISNLEMAETYALKALKVSKDLNKFESIKETNLVLAQIYHDKRNHLKAFEYQSNYIKMLETTAIDGMQKGLNALRSEIIFENQKQILVDENEAAIQKQRNYIFAGIVAFLVLLIVLLLIYRTQKIQRKFNIQLQKQQQVLLKHEGELKEANATKDRLFSIIAHDLRGPVNSFHSLIKLYVDNGLTKEEIDMIFPKALQEITRISDMLNNLLIWAKTQMFGSVNNPNNLDLNFLVNENIELLRPLAQKKSITLINNFPESIISFSDGDHINIVLRNLISNAVKFTKENGEVILNVMELKEKYQIEIKDNGLGMTKEVQAKLFDKNTTETTYGTSNEKGTGIGLLLSQEMVIANGGEIWAESSLEKGTSIFFTVPLKSKTN